MGEFGVKGNRLLHFIFRSRSSVFPFPGAGYSEHTHAWSIRPQIYIDINGYCTSNLQKKQKNPSSIPFFLFNLQFNLYISLYLSDHFFFFLVTASSASTFYSCKWMTALPSHLGSMSSGKAETPRPYCPYTENSALKLFPNFFFPSFLSLFHNCFDCMVCSEVSSGAGLGLVWPSSGFTRTNGKTSTEYFILANIFRARKRSFYSC